MSEVTVVELLKGARDLIAAGHWTQGASARTKIGHATSPYAEEAERFCLLGALTQAWVQARGLRHPLVQPEIIRRAIGHVGDQLAARRPAWGPDDHTAHLASWNDYPERQPSEVVALLEETITCLK